VFAPAVLCAGSLLVEQASGGCSFAAVMVTVAEVDPLTSQLEGFDASNAVWSDASGADNPAVRRKAGILHFKELPFQMDLQLRFQAVIFKGRFRHQAKDAWRDVYYCSELGLIVKIVPSALDYKKAMSEFEQRHHLHGCVAPQYGRCFGKRLFGTPMNLLVAAYVGPSFGSLVGTITRAMPIASGLPLIVKQLKQVSQLHLSSDHVICSGRINALVVHLHLCL
jgi:hypothetical protein